MGAIVDVVSAYNTVAPESETDQVRDLLLGNKLDVLTFTASSTVHNFVAALQLTTNAELMKSVASTTIAAIGPVTAQTLREYGMNPNIVAPTHTIPGLIQALQEFFGTNHP